MERNLCKYFERYTDSASLNRWLKALEKYRFSHSCVVPVRREMLHLPSLLKSCLEASLHVQPLMVLVINSSEGASNEEIAEQDQTTTTLSSQFDILEDSQDYLLLRKSSLTLFVIDRWSGHRQIMRAQGVGAARKLGCDLAALLIAKGNIRSQFILSTDADAVVPPDYFQATDGLSEEVSLGYFSFRHQLEGAGNQRSAMELYERWLLHYVEGLASAQSPYAVPALGSIYAINSSSYVKTRGFPDRLAAEDFYLMNKLLKIGKPKHLSTKDPIRLSGRLSHRTPFGTGPSVAKWSEMDDRDTQKIFYHPRCFEALGMFLKGQWSQLPQPLLRSLDTPQLDPSHPRRFHERFDALKTLKFIHYLRDHYFPSLSLQELLSYRKVA